MAAAAAAHTSVAVVEAAALEAGEEPWVQVALASALESVGASAQV